MKNLASRLIKARTDKGLSQAQLAKAAGLSQSTIGNLEAGLRQTSRKIAVIANILGVNALWLAEGKGKPNIEAQNVDTSLRLVNNVQAIDDNDENPEVFKVKKVTLQLTAGIVGFAVDQVLEEDNPIFFRRNWMDSRGYKPENLIALPVHGESMESGLRDGDTVVINTADRTPTDGDVFAVNYEGEAVIKRMIRDAGTWWLSSDNPDQRRFPRKECSGDMCLIIGRVVHKQSEWI